MNENEQIGDLNIEYERQTPDHNLFYCILKGIFFIIKVIFLRSFLFLQ